LHSALTAQTGPDRVSALYTRIDGSINPAQEDLLQQSIRVCRSQGHDILLLGLDTPGGLGQSMREMLKMILNAPVPVITWVGPRGAQAASAGVFLVAGSTVAAMSPQTNIGAASPVAMGGKDIPETMAKKIKNDFLSLLRGVADARNRNVDWYEKAVEEAVSITAAEAVMLRVVDMMAVSPEDLLTQVGAKGLDWKGGVISFPADGFSITRHDPGFRYSFLSWLLNPQIAYFLLLGGLAGLFFELSNPGAIFPGVFGGICLLLGLYAMAVLPTNVAGLLLILLSMVLFILEIAVSSYGLLSVGAVICLFIGSLILFDFEYGQGGLPLKVILPTILAVTSFIGLGLYLVTKAQVRPRQSGAEAMIGLQGEVTKWSGREGHVRIRGEIWRARSSSGQALQPGDRVSVTDIEGLRVVVSPT
jgi:membrane-bound serine protease (ClpP class)